MMNFLLGLVGAFGIGSLVTSIANNIMARRATASDRWYQEKREAYLGLLAALHEAAVHPSDRYTHQIKARKHMHFGKLVVICLGPRWFLSMCDKLSTQTTTPAINAKCVRQSDRGNEIGPKALIEFDLEFHFWARYERY